MKTVFYFTMLIPFAVSSQVTDSASVKINEERKNYLEEKIRFEAKVMKANPTQQNILDSEKQIEPDQIMATPTVKELNKGWYQKSEASYLKEQKKTVSKAKVKNMMGLAKIMSISEGYEGNMAEALSIALNENEAEYSQKTKRLTGPSQYDSRIELFQLDPTINWQLAIFQKSESVGMIIEKEKLTQVSKAIYNLDTCLTLGQTYNLCANEAFCNQPIVGSGTGFIFSEDTMLTASHVIERPITDYIVLFGYRIIQSDGMVETYFDAENIYYPKKIIHKSDELDVIEFQLDRKLNRPVLEWEDSGLIPKEKSEIYMLGYPLGLPLKAALNASIENNSNPLYYYTSLDSFQGNSGSPVFNFYTNKVIGMLVAGEVDYTYNGNCFYSPKCKMPYCKGEKVIRIEEIIKQF